ncbi:hypothetical protein SPRG_04923 [Saprolegnia parasitica CBS 223.65]|uniref:Uncharacterized protein n=1 Tax=Saprolegnia parasitica (strain CBS 223.65) TaxID=695850 RepID=A0A067CH43_SAPPC|nr:hypothetical protein SPRG_04923 [Saprolegnia parasitica CBS 223.65]KDO29808.1 hypothetical protein SPRG_04923 [Saprolegnia parasitica CBS 223.65]|eukprot:XP_012199451.1 hypothetical protein SPRG_04923 [Saprolegnia parasitica CBS 223.65]
MDIARLLAPLDHDDTDDFDDDSTLHDSLRNGAWSWVEERYTMALIEAFLLGAFPSLLPGTTLRGFLASHLQCVPMRVSKKLASGSLAGKTVIKKLGKSRYVPNDSLDNAHVLHKLHLLQRTFDQACKLEAMHPSSHRLCPRRPTSPVSPSRMGHWPLKEEMYLQKLISCFLNGYLDFAPGTTLRAYLADQLDCSPMRVSKKLGSGMLLGRYVPRRLGSTAYIPNRHPTAAFAHAAQEAQAQVATLRKLSFACLH